MNINCGTSGDISARVITSTSHKEQLPLSVTSTTVVTNLNAGYVGGRSVSTLFRGANDVWQVTDDGKNRFYFATNNRTYFGSQNGYEFRGSDSATNLFSVDNSGNASERRNYCKF